MPFGSASLSPRSRTDLDTTALNFGVRSGTRSALSFGDVVRLAIARAALQACRKAEARAFAAVAFTGTPVDFTGMLAAIARSANVCILAVGTGHLAETITTEANILELDPDLFHPLLVSYASHPKLATSSEDRDWARFQRRLNRAAPHRTTSDMIQRIAYRPQQLRQSLSVFQRYCAGTQTEEFFELLIGRISLIRTCDWTARVDAGRRLRLFGRS